MQNFLKFGDKFALLAINQLEEQLPPNYSHNYSPNLLITNNLNFPKISFWKKWLGEHVWEEIEDANLFFITKRKANRLHLNNHENRNLFQSCIDGRAALKLTGSFCMGGAFIFDGSYTNSGISFFNYRKMPTWFHSGPKNYTKFNASHAELWAELIKPYQHFLNAVKRKKYRRIWRGTINFLKGIEEQFIEWRHPAFVKAIDSFLRSPMNKTYKKFAKRAHFLEKKVGLKYRQNTFEKMYIFRSQLEHLHRIAKPTQKDINMTYKSEKIAREFIKYFLLQKNYQKHFENDKSIDLFWSSI